MRKTPAKLSKFIGMRRHVIPDIQIHSACAETAEAKQQTAATMTACTQIWLCFIQRPLLLRCVPKLELGNENFDPICPYFIDQWYPRVITEGIHR
jgi:hypothetical protein